MHATTVLKLQMIPILYFLILILCANLYSRIVKQIKKAHSIHMPFLFAPSGTLYNKFLKSLMPTKKNKFYGFRIYLKSKAVKEGWTTMALPIFTPFRRSCWSCAKFSSRWFLPSPFQCPSVLRCASSGLSSVPSRSTT